MTHELLKGKIPSSRLNIFYSAHMDEEWIAMQAQAWRNVDKLMVTDRRETQQHSWPLCAAASSSGQTLLE